MTVESRLDAKLFATPALARVFDAIETGGGELRVVGGAVRDAVLGRAVGEIDLATTVLPDEVMRRALTAGLGAHPTGLAHGTITVVANGQSFEVTTLRRDVETDGRHAVVAFTSSWAEDAARRDFTINALSADRAGAVFDYTGGLLDLAAGRVRFIGEAEQRIREDYLRILRFFRFSAIYAAGDLDADGLAACVALRDGLTRLSAERIGAELLKLLSAPRAADVARVMRDVGIFERILGAAGDVARLERLQTLEAVLDPAPDAIRRLAALAITTPNDIADVARRLRLSNAAVARLDAMTTGCARLQNSDGESSDRVALYRLGQKAYADAVRLAWADSADSTTDADWMNRANLPCRWMPPVMPYSGGDIVALGIAPGPRVGAVLRSFEAWWIDENFPTDAAVLREKLAALIAIH